MAASPPPETTPAEPHATALRYRWVILAGVWFVYACFGMTVASLAPLVQPITRELGISHSAMGLILGAWPLVYIAAAAPCGALTDRIGPRRTLVLAMAVVALSAILRGVAGGELALFLGVALFGLGGPLVSIGAPKLVSLWFSGRERGLAMGIYVTGSQLGVITALSTSNSVLMPLAGGSWRGVMFFYAGLAVMAAVVWWVIGRHRVAREMERRLAAEPRVRQMEVFAALVRLPAVRLILCMAVCMFCFNHSLNNWLPEILRATGMSPVSAGFWASIPTAVGILAALAIPRLATPERRYTILAGLFVSAGIATLLLHSQAGGVLALALVCQGIARGAMVAVAVLCLMETRDVSARHTGSASGLFFSAGEIGGVAGPIMVGALHDLTGGFAAALFVLTALCGLLLVLLGRLTRIVRAGP